MSGSDLGGPALVHRVADVIVECDHHAGVTSQSANDLGVDQAVMLELAGQLAVFVGQGGEWYVRHNDVTAGSVVGVGIDAPGGAALGRSARTDQ